MSKTRTKADGEPDGPPVKFEGLTPYLDAKARDHKVSAELAGKAGATWYARQIQNALGSISENAGNIAISDDDRQKMIDHAAAVCRSFHAAAEGCAAAVAEMASRHGLTVDLPDAAGTLARLQADYDAFKADSSKAISTAEADAAELVKAVGEAQAKIKQLQAEVDAYRKKAQADAAANAAKTPTPADK